MPAEFSNTFCYEFVMTELNLKKKSLELAKPSLALVYVHTFYALICLLFWILVI